jgi:EAL domain-containing protein (putative c-di-GMP-specific phosphodiesterase class I)
LGKSLGFRIVAEGVEEQAQASILAHSGCDDIQGYWYARPMPEADVLQRLLAE